MPKIVHLHSPKQKMLDNLRNIVERAERGEFTDFVFAAKLTDGGDIATSWGGDVGTRQELNAHIQLDIVMAVVYANLN